MAQLSVRRSARTITLVDPSREFEDISETDDASVIEKPPSRATWRSRADRA